MKLKKLLSLALSLMLILSVIPMGLFSITASAETATSGTTGDCTWTLDGTVLTISGSGSMENYTYSNSLPWGNSITEVIIKTGVAGIGDYAFSGCSGLARIKIPDSVMSIGNGAFEDCVELTSVNIPNSITSINYSVFFGCKGLVNITIPDSVTIIGEDAFSGCTGLTSIIIPDSVTSIGSYAFYGCRGLSSITIPNNITDIGDCTFYRCTGLTNITIGNSVTSIGKRAFSNCYNIKNIVAPKGVKYIENNTFSDCGGLENLTIKGAERLYENCFSSCNSLKNIYLSKDLKTVYNGAFGGINSIENIYYEGSEEEWNAVTILPNNDALKKANVYFNSTGIPDEVPTAPELLRKTACTVTLKQIDGCEYRVNDGEWQSSNVFTGLNPNTEYKFYRRTAAADESPAGAASYALTVVTSEVIRGDINDDREVNILDLICLKKFFADPLNNVVPSERLDVSCDGRINSADLADLRKNLLLQ